METKNTNSRTDALKRITVIDAMRGIALIGICITHAMQYFGGFPSTPFTEPLPLLAPMNEAMQWFIRYFIAAKFYIIFSFLFGLSFFIQMDSAAQKGIDFRPRFMWRLTLLLIIGILHSLVFSLDILMIYAVLGFPLVFMYKLSTKILVTLACFLLLGGFGLGVVGYKAISNTTPLIEQAEAQPRPIVKRIPAEATFSEMVVQNITTRLDGKINYQIRSGRGFMTLGLFIIGLVVGRIRLFHNLDRYLKSLIKGAGIAAGGLLTLYILQPYIPQGDPDTFVGWIFMPYTNIINLLTAYLWIVFIICAYQIEKVQKALRPLVNYGRMGMTNYVVQSIIGVFAFYGFGLGFNECLGTFLAALFGFGYTLLQIWGSNLWLNHFRYGPLEWLWRSGTYMQWQPLRKR